MIITCPFCDKKFEIDRSLIPKNGRLLQCGACDRKWHFNLSDENNEDQNTKEEFNISDSETNEVLEENNSTKKTNNQEIKESISVPIYNQESIELNNEDSKVTINEITKTSFIMKQHIKKNQELIASTDIHLVVVNLYGKPTKIPDDLKNKLSQNVI